MKYDKSKFMDNLISEWEEYYHYKHQTASMFEFIFKGYGVSFYDFMEWLKSKYNW
jgi:hypothetical protein